MKYPLTQFAFFLGLLPILTAQPWDPKPGWKDSYEANGFCWCESTFDHDLDDKKVLINGVPYSVVDVCDELTKHPSYRAFSNGDLAFNDIQCGNGPYNNAADESGCPGRVDQGPSGCNTLGTGWDMSWLEGRSRFQGGTLPVAIAIPGKVEAEDFVVDSGIKSENHNDNGGSQGIGSIHSGDHVDYVIDVANTGTYQAALRYSSKDNGGTVTFLENAVEVGSITLDATGGWNAWQTSQSAQINLTAGRHVLRLRFTGPAGFLVNLNWVDVASTTMSIGDLREEAGAQIYPNPSPGVFFLGSEDFLPDTKVSLYTLQGVEIPVTMTLNEENDLQSLPNGMYLITITDRRKEVVRRISILH